MRNRLLVAAMVGVGISALMMACGGDDTFVSPEDEDSGATGGDATAPGPDAGMGMVVDGGGTKDATTGDATTGTGNDASSGSDANGGADTSAGDTGADATADAADASDAGADAADAGDASDAADAGDAADAADAADSAVDSGTFLTPTCDGVIGATEYGPGVENKDKYTSGGQTWHMTWDDMNLYIGLEAAPIDQPVLLYLDTVAAAGLTTPSPFDGIAPANLGISADLLVFEKTSYQVSETVAAGAWTAPATGGYTVCDNAGTQTREIVLPWKLSATGRPSVFRFFGFPENGGFIFGQAPTVNQSGSGDDTANIAGWFTVSDTSPAGAGSAFASVTLAGP